MEKITLTHGLFALVDDADFEWLNKEKWHVHFGHNGGMYAVKKGKKKVFMHREILGLSEKSIHVDHRDGNGLNNQRSNLRPATPTQNRYNQPCRKDSCSGFKGVGIRRKRWLAKIKVDGKTVHLGMFDDKESAARAYDAAARIHHGEFAYLNFPDQQPTT